MLVGGGVEVLVVGGAELGGADGLNLGGPGRPPEPGTGLPVPGCDDVEDGGDVSVVVGAPVLVGGCGGRGCPGGTDAGIGGVAVVLGAEGVGTAVVVDDALGVGQGRLMLGCSSCW
jgi:hypothetical protein